MGYLHFDRSLENAASGWIFKSKVILYTNLRETKFFEEEYLNSILVTLTARHTMDFHHKFHCHFHVNELQGYETRNEKKKNKTKQKKNDMLQVRFLLSDFDTFTLQ